MVFAVNTDGTGLRTLYNLFAACGVNVAEQELLKEFEVSSISKAVEGKEHASLPGIASPEINQAIDPFKRLLT